VCVCVCVCVCVHMFVVEPEEKAGIAKSLKRAESSSTVVGCQKIVPKCKILQMAN
jgi:hypothetical protein